MGNTVSRPHLIHVSEQLTEMADEAIRAAIDAKTNHDHVAETWARSRALALTQAIEIVWNNETPAL